MNSRRRTITSISMVFLAVAILSVSALGQNAYAAMSLSVDADYDNGSISISGNTDRTGDVTIKVTAENGNLVSVDQVSPSGDSFSSTIKVSLDGTYTVSAQQGAVSAYMLSVAISSSEPSGSASSGENVSTTSTVTATTASTSGLSLTASGVEGSTTINVSGTTDRGSDITLKVIAPNTGNVIAIEQISPSGGSFMTTIETGGALWSEDGMYTISAYQGNATQYQASAEIEVVDGHVIPEFGTIAVMILVVAIVSIIIVSAKTKLSLVPRY